MPKSHKRQPRPLFPPAWTPLALSAALGIDRAVIYAALKSGELIARRKGIRRFILTGSADEVGSVVHWIRSWPRS